MDGSLGEGECPASIHQDAGYADVLLHGCRFEAHRRPSNVLTEGGENACRSGVRLATNRENAACLADRMLAHYCAHDLPWEDVQNVTLSSMRR